MKIVNFYRDRSGDLTIECDGKYSSFFHKDVNDEGTLLSALAKIEDDDFMCHTPEDDPRYPHGLEAAFVVSMTEEEIRQKLKDLNMTERERALAYVRKNLHAWPEGEEDVSVYGDDGELMFEESKYDFYPEQCEFFKEDYDFTKDEVFPWEDNTGECPYEEGTLVDVVYRDGQINLGVAALTDETGTLEMTAEHWDLNECSSSIIKHRLHVPKMEPEVSPPPRGMMIKMPTEPSAKLTGGSSNYYKVVVEKPTTLDEPYQAECNDIIEALDMTFAEGNAFKAIWRTAAARQGNGKPGTTAKYDAEKVVFFGERMLVKAEENK